MKKHSEFERGEHPKLWEEFDVDGTTVIAVPDEMMDCNDCVAKQMGTSIHTSCQMLPSCPRLSFVPKNTFNTPEMKVKLVKWRMGLNDDET